MKHTLEYYKYVRECLLAYAPKRLISDHFVGVDGNKCTIGVAQWVGGPSRFLQMYMPYEREYRAAKERGEKVYWIPVVNDMFRGTPEERYEYMVNWLGEQIANMEAECTKDTLGSLESANTPWNLPELSSGTPEPEKPSEPSTISPTYSEPAYAGS